MCTAGPSMRWGPQVASQCGRSTPNWPAIWQSPAQLETAAALLLHTAPINSSFPLPVSMNLFPPYCLVCIEGLMERTKSTVPKMWTIFFILNINTLVSN